MWRGAHLPMGADSWCGLTGLTYLTSANMHIADRTRIYQAQQHKRSFPLNPVAIGPPQRSSGTQSCSPPDGAGVPRAPPGRSHDASPSVQRSLYPWAHEHSSPSYACTQAHPSVSSSDRYSFALIVILLAWPCERHNQLQ